MRHTRAIAARSLVAALLVVISGAFFAPASAAPSKTDSSPGEGEELHQAPERVSITFDQPLDEQSSIEVTNHCNDRVDRQPTEVNGNEMSVAVTDNWAGTYHVTYVARGLAGITGQQTGSFTFSVHMGTACDGGNGGHGQHGSGPGTGHQGSGGGHQGSGGGHRSGEHTAHRSTTHGSSHATGSSTSTDHTDHASASDEAAHGDHSDHAAADEGTDATRHIRSAPVNSPVRGPGSEAVMLSLGLCALLGVLGGAVLRFSAPN